MTTISESEYNDFPDSADLLPFDTTLLGSLANANDYDCYKISLQAAGYLQISLDVPTNDANTDYFYLHLETGVMGADNIFYSNIGVDVTETLYMESPGDYYILVGPGYDAYSGGQYQLSATYSSTPLADPHTGIAPDQYELNDYFTWSDVGPLQEGDLVVDATLHNSEDTDYYQIAVAANQSMQVTLNYNASEGDLYFYLKDENSTHITGDLGANGVAEFDIAGLPAGDYALVVNGNVNNYVSSGYSITAQLGSSDVILADAYESNDSLAAATDLGALSDTINLQNLTIHSMTDDDYYQFTYDGNGIFDIAVHADFDDGDVDIELLNAQGEMVAYSGSASDVENISTLGLDAGTYYLYAYGFIGDLSSQYSIQVNGISADALDAYEGNDSLTSAYDLGAVTNQTVVQDLSLHHGADVDHYQFTYDGSDGLSVQVAFSHMQSDIDIALYDADGYYLEGSFSASDNETIYLGGYQAGTYILEVSSWDSESIDSYSLSFSTDDAPDWSVDLYDDYQDFLDVSDIAADANDINGSNNDFIDVATDLGAITSTSASIDGLTLHSWSDFDVYQFTLDGSEAVEISLQSTDTFADIDMSIMDSVGNWIDFSASAGSNESINTMGLAAGTYYLEVYGYNSLAEDYSIHFAEGGAVDGSGDMFEPNDTFATAIDMGDAVGEGSSDTLSLTSGDEDWYMTTFIQPGSSQQYVEVEFDHSDGDIDFQLYDAQQNLVRSSSSITDNEIIYLSDLAAGDYYFRVFSFDGTPYQEYTMNYSFPVDVSTATIGADAMEGVGGNDTYRKAAEIDGLSDYFDLNLHTADDIDWFVLTTRGNSSYDSFIYAYHDYVYGDLSMSLYAMDLDGESLIEIDSTESGFLNFGDYAAGTYYLSVDSDDVIPYYDLQTFVWEQEAQIESTTIALDQFDVIASNDDASTASQLGVLSRDMSIRDLTIHDSSDKDFYQFQVGVSGEVEIDLQFVHDYGDVDMRLWSGVNLIDSAASASDDESISFDATVGQTYTLEVFGYGGDTHSNYQLDISPTQLDTRLDDYEANDNAAQAVDLQDERTYLESLTLHNQTDTDWFSFSVDADANSTNQVKVSNLIGHSATLTTYAADGTTVIDTVNIAADAGSIDVSAYTAGDYYAAVSMTSGVDGAASNYNLYVDQSVASTTGNDSWTIMVYLAADNNLASAAVDDLNEMEGVVLPDSVNVVTLTDLSDYYSTSAGWSDTRVGAITADVNGYSYQGIDLVTPMTSWGEMNTGDGATLTTFIDYATANYAADNYALVVWDHGGGLHGVAWDDTSNHDQLTISELRTAIDNSAEFSSTNKLDLIGFDACLMQTYEVGLEMAAVADTMVASQETEPGDGWDYQAFLGSLANNPYASAATLGDYIVDSYDDFYGSNETLSSIDLTKLSAIATAVESFNAIVQGASADDWFVIDAAKLYSWSSSSLGYWTTGDDIDMGQFFSYIADYSANTNIATAAATIVDEIADTVLSNASHLGLSGLSATFWDISVDDSSFANSLIDSLVDAWTGFWDIFNGADRSAANTGTYGLEIDYLEDHDAFGGIAAGNETQYGAFELGTITNNSDLYGLSLHNASDVDWYEFETPEVLNAGTNELIVNALDATTAIAVTLYDEDFNVVSQSDDVSNSLALAAASSYYLQVAYTNYSQSTYYDLDFKLQTNSGLVVSDLAEGAADNDAIDKATSLAFEEGGSDLIGSLNLSLTSGDQDWYLVSAQRISEQSPNVFSVELADTNLASDADLVVEIADADGNVLATSTGVGGDETIVFEEYSNDVYINVRSDTGQQVEYSLNLAHADYDIDGDGQVADATDANALLAAMFADSEAQQIIDSLVMDVTAESFEQYLDDYGNSLLDVDGDGVIKASTDGVILNAYIAGASAADLLPYVSELSPIVTEDDLLSHLLELV